MTTICINATIGEIFLLFDLFPKTKLEGLFDRENEPYIKKGKNMVKEIICLLM